MDRLSHLWFDELIKGNFDMSEGTLINGLEDTFTSFRLGLNAMAPAMTQAAKAMSLCFECFETVAEKIAAEKREIDFIDERKIIVERGRKTKNLPNKIKKDSSRPITPKINRKLERGRNG